MNWSACLFSPICLLYEYKHCVYLIYLLPAYEYSFPPWFSLLCHTDWFLFPSSYFLFSFFYLIMIVKMCWCVRACVFIRDPLITIELCSVSPCYPTSPPSSLPLIKTHVNNDNSRLSPRLAPSQLRKTSQRYQTSAPATDWLQSALFFALLSFFKWKLMGRHDEIKGVKVARAQGRK